MARYRRRRYRRSGKWAPNITELSTTTVPAAPQSSFFSTFTIATNPEQDNMRTSQTYTIKRIEINAYIDTNSSSNVKDIEDVTAYIMYVPEGMNVSFDYNKKHPEYIMAYKYLGGPSLDDNSAMISQQYQPIRVTTRLSRKLQTGDSIILFIKGANVGTETTSFDFHGLFRWWSKAN